MFITKVISALVLVAIPGISADIDIDKVRYGDAATFDDSKGHKVATVRSTDVYLQIPSYQTIQKEGVPEGTARWNKLMKEATRDYKKALSSAASKWNYVLIIEDGGITGYPTTDATNQIIDSL